MTAMQMRPPADTGLSLSMLGLGTVKLGRDGRVHPEMPAQSAAAAPAARPPRRERRA